MIENCAWGLVTGGAGFIGSALVRHLIGRTGHQVLNLDKLAS
jgi:dTDP-glucose 4,6-dehydratase